jgi:hypothetical protein
MEDLEEELVGRLALAGAGKWNDKSALQSAFLDSIGEWQSEKAVARDAASLAYREMGAVSSGGFEHYGDHQYSLVAAEFE